MYEVRKITLVVSVKLLVDWCTSELSRGSLENVSVVLILGIQ